MAKHNQYPSQGQQSVKIRAKPLKGPSCQVADFAVQNDVCILSADEKHARKKSNYQTSELMSTANLISTAARIWESTSDSLSRFQPKASFNHSETISQTDSELCYLFGGDNFGIRDSVVRCLHVDLKSSSYFPTIVQQSLESLRPSWRITYVPCDNHFIEHQFLSNCHHSSVRDHMHLKEISLTNARILYSLGNSHRCSQWSHLPLPTFWYSKVIVSSFSRAAASGCPVPRHEVSLSSNSATGILGSCIDVPNDVSLGASAELVTNRRAPLLSLYSEHCLQAIEDTLSAARIPTLSSLGLNRDLQVSISGSGYTSELLNEIEDRGLLKNKMQQNEKLDAEAKLLSDTNASATSNPHPLLAKQEHAVSGALAGIVVSLCLHPVDTIKTVVQSCRAGGQTSICFIGQSIISERGLSGLYRGITGNITTSAPISAIYTFTYESVKALLLPSLSKEYHSVAHCTAGACASIATSFIFTPSEHIKQQMQVNSRHRHCWNAVFRIVEKGGLLSLYTGWGAVLCRNIPHSIIKFYTYESLKQMFMSSQQPTIVWRTRWIHCCSSLYSL